MMEKVLVNVSDILRVFLNIVSILKELVGLSFGFEFEVGPLRRRQQVPSNFGQYFYSFTQCHMQNVVQ
jgi:hypothetical protein